MNSPGTPAGAFAFASTANPQQKCWITLFKRLPDEDKLFIEQYNSIKDLQAMKASSESLLTPRP